MKASTLRFLRDALLKSAIPGLLLLPPAAAGAQELPTYDFQVNINTKAHLVRGTVRITVPADDPRPRDTWWFHLPPNRFLEQDRRDYPRRLEPLGIGFRYTTPDTVDPMLPNGFSAGEIEIVSVRDAAGRALTHGFEANPRLPPGYWRKKGLLRVAFLPGEATRTITIEFVTRLPNQHVDGWDDQGIVAELWHPVLLPYRNGKWVRDPFAPAGGLFNARVSVDRGGWLIAGGGFPYLAQPGHNLAIPALPRPQRTFPLIFRHGGEMAGGESEGMLFNSFYQRGNGRVGDLAMETGALFHSFLSRHFGLARPGVAVTFVESEMRMREMVTVGNTVLIPTVYFKNNPVLDRVFVAKLARAMGEIWFGETVWSNRDTQAWLHLGLTGYLALEYFKFRYGWDASIHDLVDWLSPKYREHFFEAPVLERYRSGYDSPLAISVYHHPVRGTVMATLFQKAPLVFRSLAYVIGEETFAAGLEQFYRTHHYQEVTIESFREALEETSGRALKWYFDQWYYGTTRLDYALGAWDEEPGPEGYRVAVEVRRLAPGVMPVDVQVQGEGGVAVTKRWAGNTEETLMIFTVPTRVVRIALDPEEFLLETNRKNNYSTHEVRWRPFYDWSKERESLVTFVARLGGNAIDGNIIGIGTNIRFNDENQLSIIPIYGENAPEMLFEVSFTSLRVFDPRFTFLAFASRLGGRQTVSSGFKYKHPSAEENLLDTTFLLTGENVESASLGPSAQEPVQQAGKTNNINILHTGILGLTRPFSTDWEVDGEYSQPGLGSDFEYASLFGRIGQNVDLNINNTLRFELLRGFTEGDAPIQKLHLLGDPLVLRGFPRTVNLVSDNIAALRSEYHWVLTRRIYGETIQTRKVTLILFGDIGKGWNNQDNFDDALTRRDAGFGFNLDLNALSMLDFPVRVEVAFPLGDPEYKDRQLIFFQALAFF